MWLVAFTSFLYSCSNGQNGKTLVSAQEFSSQITSATEPIIVDVRTEEEFAGGHIDGAMNINWRSPDFEAEAQKLNKVNTVYVYCLSGGRSASAAGKLSSMGFKQIVELDGGILKWKSENLPVVSGSTSNNGYDVAAYEDLIDANKLVIVDFYADWCGPCKKLKPILEEIDKENEDVVIVRIDVDKNQQLATTLRIDALPTLKLYKGKRQVWNFVGYIGKEGILQQIRSLR